MRKAAFGRRRPLKLFDVSAAQIKRPPGGPRKVKSSEAAMLQEIVQSLEGDTAAFLINGGTLLGPDNGHHRSKTGTSGTSIPNPVSSIASSSTPAADFLKLIGARPKSTPSAAVPAMPLSQSPKRTIHLSGGHASEARLRKRDVRPPTNTVKQARAPSSPVKGRDAPGSSGDARSRPTQKASFASALPAQPTLSAARGPPRPSQSSGLASQLTIPNGDLTQLPASAVFDRLPSSASAGTASRDDVATGEVSNGRNQAASSENSAHVADHGLPSPPATQDTVSYDPNHQVKTLLASLAARSQPRRLRSPSIIAIESPAPLNTSVKQARARSPSITLISTPRKRLIPIVELLSSARKVWKAKSIRPPIDRVKVVIGIARRRRALLIKRGFYGTSISRDLR